MSCDHDQYYSAVELAVSTTSKRAAAGNGVQPYSQQQKAAAQQARRACPSIKCVASVWSAGHMTFRSPKCSSAIACAWSSIVSRLFRFVLVFLSYVAYTEYGKT